MFVMTWSIVVFAIFSVKLKMVKESCVYCCFCVFFLPVTLYLFGNFLHPASYRNFIRSNII